MDTQQKLDRTRQHDLTIEEIKACVSFAHFTDEQAKEVIETLKVFTKIVFDFHQNTRENLEKTAKKPILKE